MTARQVIDRVCKFAGVDIEQGSDLIRFGRPLSG